MLSSCSARNNALLGTLHAYFHGHRSFLDPRMARSFRFLAQPLQHTSRSDPPCSHTTSIPFLARAFHRSIPLKHGLHHGNSTSDTHSFSLTTTSDNQSDMSILKNLVQYLWPRDDWRLRARVVAAMSLLIAGKVLNVQVPYLFKQCVDRLTDTAILVGSAGGAVDVMTVCGSVLLGYGAARIGATCFSELRSAIFGAVAQRAIRRVSKNIFEHLLNQDISFHLTAHTGALTRALDRGTKGIAFVLSSMVFHVVPTGFEIVLVCGILTNSFGFAYTAVTLATTVAYIWFTVATTAWRTQFRKEMNASDNRAAARAVDSLVNIEVVNYFGSAARESKLYDKALASYELAAIKTTTSLAFLNAGQASIFAVSLTAVMWMASSGILQGNLTIGDLVMINGLLFQLSVPLNFLGTVYREFRQALTDMHAMFSLQQVRPKVCDAQNALSLQWEKGIVEFDRVSFNYSNGRDILRHVSFRINPGEKIALVGPSGCGKSTLIKLLFRLYDPSKGSINVDGQNISGVTLSSLRERLSIVPQDTALFNDTIEYNIKYGQPDASDTEMIVAAKQAQIHSMIDKIPKGYQTAVGERGLILSGGERQRLVLARALLRNPQILVLDEGTSALDTFTETSLIHAVEEYLSIPRKAGSTNLKPAAIMIAHRLTTVARCDRIYVMSNGQIVEVGTHYKLLSTPDSLYRKMWLDQHSKDRDQP